MRSSERGFTVIEVVIASAVIALMAITGLAACKAIANVTAAAYTAGHDVAAIDTQAARLRDDAATAFAIFVPPSDMNGASNNGPGGGHEVDYYAKGDNGQEYLWRYFYDAARHTLQRYDYDPGGTTGVRDVATGSIDRAAAYPPIRAVTAFEVHTVAANELGSPDRNPYSGVAALLAHTPQPLGVSYDHPNLNIPQAVGGNTIVEVTLANEAAARVVHLAAGSMPTGFTVTGLPRWHAIVYRVDQTHRFGFGFFGKSHVYINARVDVSYDRWQSRAPWCDFNLYGNPDGLDGHDPHADYKPDEVQEQAESLLSRCRQLHPTPPPRDSPGNPPEPGVVTKPLPGPTPPPCWSAPGPQGRCWPADAPADWAPPSPLPVDTPPPAWCETRAESVACKAKSPPKMAG